MSEQVFDEGYARDICAHLRTTMEGLENGTLDPEYAARRIKSIINCFRPEFQTGPNPNTAAIGSGSGPVITGVALYNPVAQETVVTVYETVADWKRDSGLAIPLPGKWELWNFKMVGESRVELPPETKKKLFT